MKYYSYKDKLYALVGEGRMKVNEIWIDSVVYRSVEDGNLYTRSKKQFFNLFTEVDPELPREKNLLTLDKAISRQMMVQVSDPVRFQADIERQMAHEFGLALLKHKPNIKHTDNKLSPHIHLTMEYVILYPGEYRSAIKKEIEQMTWEEIEKIKNGQNSNNQTD